MIHRLWPKQRRPGTNSGEQKVVREQQKAEWVQPMERQQDWMQEG
jgi:hypothetical protein